LQFRNFLPLQWHQAAAFLWLDLPVKNDTSTAVGKPLNLETSGAKRLIPAAIIILVAIGGLLLFNTATTPPPTLVFKGYEISATNTNAMAKLELRNTTGRDIWLCYCVSEFPSHLQFLERSTAGPPKLTNDFRAFPYSFAEKVLPGDTVQLKCPLNSGEPAKHVGINYYFGKFLDENDFLHHLSTPVLLRKLDGTLKPVSFWQRLRGKFKAPKRHEIWCNDLLAFEAATTNSLPKPRW
jgi:hypothetical protein